MFGHVIFKLVDPFAFIATFWAEIFAFIHMNPHVILKESTSRTECQNWNKQTLNNHLSYFIPLILKDLHMHNCTFHSGTASLLYGFEYAK